MLFVSLLAASVATPVLADPVDNEGDARFRNVTGNYKFWKFSSPEQLTSNPSSNPEFIDAYVDSNGDVSYSTSFFGTYPSAQTIGSAGTVIDVQVVVTDVTGIVDFSSGIFFDWEITAQLRFRSIGASGVTTSNCRTASFTINIDGDFMSGADSAAFTIPALSGTGTGACNGHSTEINLDFDLGSSGAVLTLNKWGGFNTDTGDPLTGS